MELNQQRKVFIAILALAGGGLIVDRFVLGAGVTEPASAEAAGPDLAVPSASRNAAVPVVAGPTISERLASLRESTQGQPGNEDAFATPVWLRPQLKDQASSTVNGLINPDIIAPTVRVSALVAGTSPLAVIDGKPMRPGDSIKTAQGQAITLRHVEPGGVIIESQGQLFRVELRGTGDNPTP